MSIFVRLRRTLILTTSHKALFMISEAALSSYALYSLVKVPAKFKCKKSQVSTNALIKYSLFPGIISYF